MAGLTTKQHEDFDNIIEQTLEEAEKIKEQETEDKEIEKNAEEVLTSTDEEDKQEEGEKKEKEEETKDQQEELGKKEEVDYEARYRGSTREAQVLMERNKFYKEAVKKAESLPKPTEEDLVKELGEEEVSLMDEKQKQIAIDSLWAKRKYSIVHEAIEKDKKVEEWIDSVKEKVKDPQLLSKFPDLEGNEEDFVKFAAMPSRIGLDVESLVKIFLFDRKPVKKRKNVLLGKSGSRAKPKPKKISVAEAAKIRVNNPKLYKKLVLADKIDFGI